MALGLPIRHPAQTQTHRNVMIDWQMPIEEKQMHLYAGPYKH